MNRIDTDIHVGATHPFLLVHASDTHLTRVDERDDERKRALAIKRARIFPNNEQYLVEISELARSLSAPIVHTGDLIDFVSCANLDGAKDFINQNDCFFVAGNHEFSLYVGEAFEDEAYRAQSLDRVQACFHNDIRFSSRVINGVNLVAIDNSYYRFDKPQYDALLAEVAKGLPILLFMHCAIYEEAIAYEAIVVQKQLWPSLVSPPASALAGCPELRVRQQMPDEITKEVSEYIKNEPAIKGIFTGHYHWDYDGMLTPEKPQYVTGTESLRVIHVC